MQIMTITGLSVQVDVLEGGEMSEAKAVLNAINISLKHLEGEPQIMGVHELQCSQVDVEEDEEGEDDE